MSAKIQSYTGENVSNGKVGRFFAMVISSDFRVGQHRDDDHEEDAPYFMTLKL